MRHQLMSILVGAVLLGACGAETTTPIADDTKPVANPDTTVAEGRADALSNRWTTRMGALGTDARVEASIDYPDWFHGYTLDLEEGQELAFSITASERGYLRVYGPAHRVVDGEPQFTNAIGRANGVFGADFDFVVPQTGIYMVLYGPELVWSADYTIDVSCQNCGPQRCTSHDDCASDEFCGDNGVRCITSPCDANFDICQPRQGEGDACNEDEMCGPDLACRNAQCTAVGTDECADAADCDTGWCGYDATGGRICKDYVAEGDACGGFVRPQDYEACPPDLTCTAPDFIADIRGNCGIAVTVADLLQDPATYDGRFVGVKGYIDAGFGYCTRIGCPTTDPCCNRCGSTQNLYVDATADRNDGVTLMQNGSEFSCSGDECSWDSCTATEGVYWVGGFFRADPNGGNGSIDVSRYYQGF